MPPPQQPKFSIVLPPERSARSHTMSQKFGVIIIGDDILSGKRADKHLPKTIELLAARGLQDQITYLRLVSQYKRAGLSDVDAAIRAEKSH